MSLRERTRPGLGIIEPCLPSPAKAPPSGPGWIHEIKHDGFRIMARRDGAGVRLVTRHGNDFTSRFPLAVAAVQTLPGRSFLIDGRSHCPPMSAVLPYSQTVAFFVAPTPFTCTGSCTAAPNLKHRLSAAVPSTPPRARSQPESGSRSNQ